MKRRCLVKITCAANNKVGIKDELCITKEKIKIEAQHIFTFFAKMCRVENGYCHAKTFSIKHTSIHKYVDISLLKKSIVNTLVC